MKVMRTEEFRDWRGRTLYGLDNEKIGKITDIYLDQQSGEPEWAAVATGLFGQKVSFIPLTPAQRRGDDVIVPFSKDVVKDAPHAEENGILSPAEEARLFRHYDDVLVTLHPGPLGNQSTSPPGKNTDHAMTRSEEELSVATTTQASGRTRLRKWVEVEHVTHTIPVSHEEVRVDRELITEANLDQALSGPAISTGVHEVVLHEEQVVTTKRTVPVERVRLVTETVTEDQQVAADIRKERIDVEHSTEA
jgi:uncharacterized protein (TIGR02271 family)